MSGTQKSNPSTDGEENADRKWTWKIKKNRNGVSRKLQVMLSDL